MGYLDPEVGVALRHYSVAPRLGLFSRRENGRVKPSGVSTNGSGVDAIYAPATYPRLTAHDRFFAPGTQNDPDLAHGEDSRVLPTSVAMTRLNPA